MAGKRKRDILAEPSSDDVEPLVAGEKTRGRPSRGRAKTEAVPAGGEASKKAARKRPSAKEAVGSAAAKEEEEKKNVQDGFPNGFPDYYKLLGVDSSASTEMIHEADPCHGCDNAMRRNCIRNFPLKLETFRMTIL